MGRMVSKCLRQYGHGAKVNSVIGKTPRGNYLVRVALLPIDILTGHECNAAKERADEPEGSGR